MLQRVKRVSNENLWFTKESHVALMTLHILFSYFRSFPKQNSVDFFPGSGNNLLITFDERLFVVLLGRASIEWHLGDINQCVAKKGSVLKWKMKRLTWFVDEQSLCLLTQLTNWWDRKGSNYGQLLTISNEYFKSRVNFLKFERSIKNLIWNKI